MVKKKKNQLIWIWIFAHTFSDIFQINISPQLSPIEMKSIQIVKFLHLAEKKTLEKLKSQFDGLCLRVRVKRKAAGTRRLAVGGFGK